MRRTVTALLLATLPVTVTATATATPTATPSLSQAETMRLCSVAVAEAAPAWEDWNYAPGDWQDDPRTPEVCQGLADEENPPRGNRAFMQVLIDGLEMADDPRAEQ
ncbi:hypothetical protein AB0M58_38975 [Streptomyces bobili]|uniref:hypothetical protein n=1 Tax=Streptomyces bobili TaxID=67280 RepID=UPI003444BED6